MSKGSNLKKLKKENFNVPELEIYKVSSFLKNKKQTISNIKKKFRNFKIAIRSSHNSEDSENLSNAGKFKSFLNINTNNEINLEKKIYEVVNAYKTVSNNLVNQEFIIQRMVNDINISGVVLTRDINNFNDFYVINYFIGNDSAAVTSGKKNTKTIKYFYNRKYKLSEPFNKLLKIIRKIEKKFNYPLDIEFIIDKKKNIYILQVRKLIIKNEKKHSRKLDLSRYFHNLEKKIEKLQLPHHSLLGGKNFFGVMPDWNPAEIIGKKPKPLALSLYQELITDHIWAINRDNYGYKDLQQFHLMTTFFGTPYIDIRIDFNSWIPKKLEKETQNKIVNYYLSQFEKNLNSHDKIEKDIIFSCYNFSSKEKIKDKLSKILTDKEMKKFISSLKEINGNALYEKNKDLNKIFLLLKKQYSLEKSKLYFIDKIYWHTEECKHYGTLPFAGLARCGFIAMDLLNSFVEKKIFSNDDRDNLLQSIKTVSSEINSDLIRLNKRNFLRKHGHIRPNTYEITSKNYNEGYNNYFNPKKNSFKKTKFHFKLSNLHLKKIRKFIKKSEIYKTPEELIEFIKSSIQAREFSKYVFSKSINYIFENLEKFGKKYGILKKDLSYLDFQEVLKLYFNLSSLDAIPKIKDVIKKNKKEYLVNSRINLPDIIINKKDIYIQKIQAGTPNFVTNKKVTGEKIFLKEIGKKFNLNDKVICIENADPGYDFIFSYSIKGLITQFGGYNSHMAIRCSELNIPAVIGVGEKIFMSLKNCNTINIDCKNKKIDTL